MEGCLKGCNRKTRQNTAVTVAENSWVYHSHGQSCALSSSSISHLAALPFEGLASRLWVHTGAALSHQACSLAPVIRVCLLTTYLFPGFSHCCPRVQKSVTFPGYFSANSEEAGCHASLRSLKTALRQLQAVTLNIVVPTIKQSL